MNLTQMASFSVSTYGKRKGEVMSSLMEAEAMMRGILRELIAPRHLDSQSLFESYTKENLK